LDSAIVVHRITVTLPPLLAALNVIGYLLFPCTLRPVGDSRTHPQTESSLADDAITANVRDFALHLAEKPAL
jgi:hypothetical protein